MKRTTQVSSLLAVTAATFSLAGTVSGASIGVDFVNNDTGGVQDSDVDSLFASEVAGAPDYAQTNWNNFGRWGQTVDTIDSSGNSNGVTITWDSNNTWQNAANVGTPDGKLMYGYLDATGDGSGNNIDTTPYAFFDNANKPEAYATGISNWLAAQGATKYDVVVYLDGDATGGRICEVWLQEGSSGDPPTVLGSDLTPHVFVRDSANFAGTYTQVPLTANSTGTAADGNYVAFLDQTSDSFILRTEERGFHGAFINGFQIVPRTNAAPPKISAHPTSSSVYSGRTARFLSGATGSAPLGYQWQKDGTNVVEGGNVSGSSTNTLVISDVTASDIGGYALIVSNAGGSVTSSVASLTITAPPAPGGYADAILTNGPAAHWRLNEMGNAASGDVAAFDFVGGYAGIYGADSAPGMAGPQSPTFPGLESDNTGVDTTYLSVNPSWVTVPTPAVNTNTVTITAWIYSYGVQADGTGIFMTRGDTTAGLIFNSDDNQLGYTWNSDSIQTWGWDSELRPPDYQWAFVALVIEPSRATLYLGVDGVLTNAANALAHVNEAWGGTGWIGNDSGNTDRTFYGIIDEVAMFSRSLSFNEIAALYATATGIPQDTTPTISSHPVSLARYSGRTVQFFGLGTGTEPLSYQWQKGGADLSDGSDITGTTTDTLTVSNITAASGDDYTLVVSNDHGSSTSMVATLTVVLPAIPYETNIITASPEAFWRLNEVVDPITGTETAFDYWGGFNATYAMFAYNGYNGITGPTTADGYDLFGSENYALEAANNVSDSFVTTPALNFSSDTTTITTWVYPIGTPINWSGIVFSRGGSPATGLNINGSGNLGYHWNDQYWDVDSGLALPVYQWSFVALAVNPTQATLYLYNTNGLQSFTSIGAHASHTFSSGFRIGGDPQGDDRTFQGRVDEVAVFDYALTQVQIETLLGIATAPVSLAIERSGAQLMLSWPTGTLLESDQVLGPWTTNTATSPYFVSPTADRRYYRLRVR